MPNSLTAEAGLKLGPIVVETFFKHYLEYNSESSKATRSEGSSNTTLREQDLLWQESFEIIKSFLNQATKHTVEELQEFSNARIPVAPWIYVKRVLVPVTICDKAAKYLIKAFGGDAATKRVVGGTKWWQVRGMRGVDCQWICQKSQMRTCRKHHKSRENHRDSEVPVFPPSARFSPFRKLSNQWGNFNPDKLDHSPEGLRSKNQNDSSEKEASQEGLAGMDGTRCMLYAHGGGYYFGSVDQERYCLQRYARKIRGRVFAVNYRLAPQYPFPCAIQDMLAAYLYLIDPPLEATHAPIPPNQVVLGGDSAGGGLCLAMLQVMRDSGIPLPAAAVLISPWSDLTHSFPSLLQNTETDIIPPYGLCLHKPSVLWPPPPDEISSIVRRGLRERFKTVARRVLHAKTLVAPSEHPLLPQVTAIHVEGVEIHESFRTDVMDQQPMGAVSPIPSEGKDRSAPEVNSGTPDITDNMHTADYSNHICKSSGRDPLPGRLPLPWEPSQSIELLVDGKRVTVDSQIQLYCPNNILTHPFISPVLGYLGGLPPLLIIASDKEVLRDEIVYVAHKAAYPDQYPIHEDSRSLYPPLQHLQTPYRPTPVHLQVYDDTAHVLPLFSFTTPAKYCYRAIAEFTKHLTSPSIEPPELHISVTPTDDTLESRSPSNLFLGDDSGSPMSNILTLDLQRQSSPTAISGFSSLKGSQSSHIAQRYCPAQLRQTTVEGQTNIANAVKEDSGDVAGNRFKNTENQPQGPGTAGNPSVYADNKWPAEGIIRERVSINGILRSLEPESEIPALKFPHERLGRINEGVARRYLKGQGLWAKKFGQTARKIETQRKKNLEAAKCETIRTVESIAQLQDHLFHEHDIEADSRHYEKTRTRRKSMTSLQEADAERQKWTWAWALDDDEHPPPSSIVSRRDTAEARRLARVADLSLEQEESKLSGNMLWSVLVNFLTAHPRHKQEHDDDSGGNDDAGSRPDDEIVRSHGRGSILRRLKSFGGRPTGQSLTQDPLN